VCTALLVPIAAVLPIVQVAIVAGNIAFAVADIVLIITITITVGDIHTLLVFLFL
jgi:hypothetical protein